jgi:trans-2-enoyl-CoA reductase
MSIYVWNVKHLNRQSCVSCFKDIFNKKAKEKVVAISLEGLEIHCPNCKYFYSDPYRGEFCSKRCMNSHVQILQIHKFDKLELDKASIIISCLTCKTKQERTEIFQGEVDFYNCEPCDLEDFSYDFNPFSDYNETN